MPAEEDEMGNGPEMVAMLDNPQMFAFLIPIVAIVGGITFVTVVHWLDTQRKEREAYYKAETLEAHNRGLGRRRQSGPRSDASR